MTSNGQFTSWPTRFTSEYEDPTGALCKLTQKGSVVAYQSEFEDLANRVMGGLPLFLLSCFVSDLTPKIRHEVQAHQLLTFTQATSLARLQEEKLFDHRPSPPPPCPRPPSLTNPGPLHPNPHLTLLPPSPR